MDENTIARFWRKVDKGGPGGCWLWTGGAPSGEKPGKGHGLFSWKLGGRRFTRVASRVAWQVTHGDIPEGLLVLHECDVCRCVNPAHLFLGTHQDNVDDMFRKGRGRKALGADAGMAILSTDQAISIRARCAAGEKRSALAYEHGVSLACIHDLVSGRSWKHL